jgi:hypothetical protein
LGFTVDGRLSSIGISDWLAVRRERLAVHAIEREASVFGNRGCRIMPVRIPQFWVTLIALRRRKRVCPLLFEM